MASSKKRGKNAQISDILMDDFDKFEHFAVTYLKQIIAACVAVIVIAVIVVVIYTLHASAERKAENIIANAATIEELQQVIKDYSGRKAVWTAYHNLIRLCIEKKEFAKAYEYAGKFLALKLPEELRVPLELNMGYMLENSNKKREAADRFAAISNDGAYPAAIRIEAAYSAGRIEAALGNRDAARKYLEAAVRNTAGASSGESGLWQKMAISMLMNMDKEPVQAAPAPEKSDAQPAGN